MQQERKDLSCAPATLFCCDFFCACRTADSLFQGGLPPHGLLRRASRAQSRDWRVVIRTRGASPFPCPPARAALSCSLCRRAPFAALPRPPCRDSHARCGSLAHSNRSTSSRARRARPERQVPPHWLRRPRNLCKACTPRRVLSCRRVRANLCSLCRDDRIASMVRCH